MAEAFELKGSAAWSASNLLDPQLLRSIESKVSQNPIHSTQPHKLLYKSLHSRSFLRLNRRSIILSLNHMFLIRQQILFFKSIPFRDSTRLLTYFQAVHSSTRSFNRIIRFIKQQLIYCTKRETCNEISLDINSNAILIDSEASSWLFVFSAC